MGILWFMNTLAITLLLTKKSFHDLDNYRFDAEMFHVGGYEMGCKGLWEAILSTEHRSINCQRAVIGL